MTTNDAWVITMMTVLGPDCRLVKARYFFHSLLGKPMHLMNAAEAQDSFPVPTKFADNIVRVVDWLWENVRHKVPMVDPDKCGHNLAMITGCEELAMQAMRAPNAQVIFERCTTLQSYFCNMEMMCEKVDVDKMEEAVRGGHADEIFKTNDLTDMPAARKEGLQVLQEEGMKGFMTKYVSEPLQSQRFEVFRENDPGRMTKNCNRKWTIPAVTKRAAVHLDWMVCDQPKVDLPDVLKPPNNTHASLEF